MIKSIVQKRARSSCHNLFFFYQAIPEGLWKMSFFVPLTSLVPEIFMDCPGCLIQLFQERKGLRKLEKA